MGISFEWCGNKDRTSDTKKVVLYADPTCALSRTKRETYHIALLPLHSVHLMGILVIIGE